jgi:DNA replication protein DnaC
MGYSSENVKRVREEFREKRDRADAAARKRKEQLYALSPEIMQIDRELSAVGSSILEAALSSRGEELEQRIAALRESHKALRHRRDDIVESFGYPKDYSDVKYECGKCSDTGFTDKEMCSCMKEALAVARMEDSGIGSLMSAQSFDTFSLDYYSGGDREAVQRNYLLLRRFAEEFHRGTSDSWLLTGPTGLGKTHLSTAVAKRVIQNGCDVVYTTMFDLISAFERQRFGAGSGDDGTTDKYLEADLLILDDLGTEIVNQFTISVLYNIINSRLNHRLSTIINTNLTAGELRDKYADRITSRLFGEYGLLLFKGRDVRAQKLSGR